MISHSAAGKPGNRDWGFAKARPNLSALVDRARLRVLPIQNYWPPFSTEEPSIVVIDDGDQMSLSTTTLTVGASLRHATHTNVLVRGGRAISEVEVTVAILSDQEKSW
ncbi:hypothetical protein [Xanthomonas sacchari]|uniref:hypothetical protein n=1 Tax=Xanthomonas sacchari TaxID=56458 RepID=UPI00225A7C88|nr:hypothetical protein [Xanthomonas sacchari]